MWAISGMLLFQHWNIILLDVPTILLTCIDLFKADKNGVERFGDDYKAYMKKLQEQTFCSVLYADSGKVGNKYVLNQILIPYPNLINEIATENRI
jgi:hypothetical protein